MAFGRSLGLCLFLAACSRPTETTVAAPLAQAASVRLFDAATGNDYTFHIPLSSGYTTRIKVRLYVADGREIVPLQDKVALSLTFAPDTLATSVTADSALLLEDVTPTSAPGTLGDMTLKITATAAATTKTFGPFQVLVH